MGFEYIKYLYENDYDFSKFYDAYEKVTFERYYRHNGFLFRDNRLCVPMSSMHELFMREAHEDEFMEHFSVVKTLHVLHDYLYWLNMHIDV